MKIFGLDSPLYKFVTWLWDIIRLSLLWTICSIPIVTIGPSTVALCYVTNQMVEDQEGRIVHTFFREFKNNLKKGIPLGLIALVCFYAVYLDFQLYKAIEGEPIYFLIMGILALVIFLMSFIYAFHLMARYENTLLRTIRNSYDIATKYFVRTILLVLIIAVEYIFWFWNLTTILIGTLAGPGVVAFTISTFAMKVFHEIEKEAGNGE